MFGFFYHVNVLTYTTPCHNWLRCETAPPHPGEFLGHSQVVLNMSIPSDEAYLAHLYWHERHLLCIMSLLERRVLVLCHGHMS